MIRNSKRPRTGRRFMLLAAVALCAAALVGVGLAAGTGQTNAAASVRTPNFTTLLLGSTTSVRDSGLMDKVVLHQFAGLHPEVTVKPAYVGSGQAMTNAQAGNYDVIIVHWPSGESNFMAQGFGTLRLPVMYNYFTVVGPTADPAKVRTATSAAQAFARIAAYANGHSGSTWFVSRGDVSGTYEEEVALWKQAKVKIDPKSPPSWYITTGQGMGPTLTITNQKNAYTLTDTSTFIEMQPATSTQAGLSLVRLSRVKAQVKNQYDIILLNQAKFPNINSAAAEELAQYLVSSQGQQAIAQYRQYGQQMFFPDASTISSYPAPRTP
jgi:tungstate transport system substrate-binding protein